MKKTVFAWGATLLLACNMICAQEQTAASGVKKVALVNIDEAIHKCDEGRKVTADIQKRFTATRNELEPMSKEVIDLANKIKQVEDKFGGPRPPPTDAYASLEYMSRLARRGDAVISYGGKILNYEQLKQLFDQKAKELYKRKDAHEHDYSPDTVARLYDAIRDRMMQVIGEYGKKNGFFMVLNSAPKEHSSPAVLWAEQQTDITDEIVKAYNVIFGSAAPATQVQRQLSPN